MCAPSVRVEWGKPPEQWLMPAAVVFDMAVRQSQPPPCDTEGEIIVIHVSIGSAKDRLPEGEQLGSMSFLYAEPVIELVPEPMVYRLPMTPVVSTRIGKYLSDHHLLKKLLNVLIGIFVVLLALDPFKHEVEVKDPHSSSGRTLNATKSHTHIQIVRIGLMLLTLLICAHLVPTRLLLLTISYFEPLMILLCASIGAITKFMDRYDVFPNKSEFMGFPLVVSIVHCCLEVMCHGVAGSVDALAVSSRHKFAMAALFFLSLIFSYTNSVIKNEWSSQPICFMDEKCTSLVTVYRSAKLNEIIFALKVLLTLCLGYPYAVLKASFINPTSNPVRLSAINRNMGQLRNFLTQSEKLTPSMLSRSSVVAGVMPRFPASVRSISSEPSQSIPSQRVNQETAAGRARGDAGQWFGPERVIAAEFPDGHIGVQFALQQQTVKPASNNLFMDIFEEVPVQTPSKLGVKLASSP